jgi:hypothetical protein
MRNADTQILAGRSLLHYIRPARRGEAWRREHEKATSPNADIARVFIHTTRMRRILLAVGAVAMVAATTTTPPAVDEEEERFFQPKNGGGVLLSPADIPDGNWMSLGEGGAEVLLQDHDDATLDAETAKLLTEARRRFLSGYVRGMMMGIWDCCWPVDRLGIGYRLVHE